MDDKPLVDGGTHQLDVTNESRVEKYPMDFGKAESLTVFSRYQFFTPAPLYLYAGLSDRTWAQMMQEANRDITLMFHRFKYSIFRGLDAPNGDKDWNRVLWAATKEDFEVIETYLLSLTSVDQTNKRVIKVGAQDVLITDPLAVDQMKVVDPKQHPVSIVSFGVNANDRCVAFEPESQPPVLPRLTFFAPQPKIVNYAKTLFGGFENSQIAADQLERPDED